MLDQAFKDLVTRKRARLDLVNREGSPVFPLTFGAITGSGGREYHEIRASIPAARKYEPMDLVVLTNRSAEVVDVEINGLAFDVLPANTRVTISEQAIWSLALINNATGNIAAGAITATFQRAPLSVDRIARGDYGR